MQLVVVAGAPSPFATRSRRWFVRALTLCHWSWSAPSWSVIVVDDFTDQPRGPNRPPPPSAPRPENQEKVAIAPPLARLVLASCVRRVCVPLVRLLCQATPRALKSVGSMRPLPSGPPPSSSPAASAGAGAGAGADAASSTPMLRPLPPGPAPAPPAPAAGPASGGPAAAAAAGAAKADDAKGAYGSTLDGQW